PPAPPCRGPGRRSRLRPLALGFDGLPWPAAALRSLPAVPHPAPTVPHPALADQGPGEPVVVLREVVAEAPLHAGRALVGGVELDVRGGDPRDPASGHVQVDLATDAAVRADGADDPLGAADLGGSETLPRQGLEDGSGGAYADALAAPRT